jgi:hypothetical protein
MAKTCCCIPPHEPSDNARCWPVSSCDQCGGDPDCACRETVPPVCVAARMAEDHLVTPFIEQPAMITAVADTYVTMYDVRDLLRLSDLGQRVLQYGKEVSDETARIAAEDPELGDRIFETLMRALSFARAMDRERLRPGASPYERRFSQDDFDFGVRVADDVRSRTRDGALIAALDDLQDQASRFIGLTPAEALGVLFG